MTVVPIEHSKPAVTAVTPALEVRDLVVRYGSGRKAKRATPAVDGVSFDLAAGETLGIVGESGSGKSTIGKAVLGLHKPTSGTVRLQGTDITSLSLKQRRSLAVDLRVVFQDPYSSLNPARTIGQTLVEPLRLLGVGETEANKRARESLVSVGLPGEAVERYPSQFSGGQRQRVAIARALVCRPKVVVLDEPVSALDLSSQAQVLNLLADLREQHNLAFLFIAHDLGVVRFLSQRAVVLYRGQVMESGPVESITQQPGIRTRWHSPQPLQFRGPPSRPPGARPVKLWASAWPVPPNPHRPAAPSCRAARWPPRSAAPSDRRCDWSTAT